MYYIRPANISELSFIHGLSYKERSALFTVRYQLISSFLRSFSAFNRRLPAIGCILLRDTMNFVQ